MTTIDSLSDHYSVTVDKEGTHVTLSEGEGDDLIQMKFDTPLKGDAAIEAITSQVRTALTALTTLLSRLDDPA